MLPIILFGCSSIGNIKVQYQEPTEFYFPNKTYNIKSFLGKASWYFVEYKKSQEFIGSFCGFNIDSTHKFYDISSNYIILFFDEHSSIMATGDDLDAYRIIIKNDTLLNEMCIELNDNNTEVLRAIGFCHITQFIDLNGSLNILNYNHDSLIATINISFGSCISYYSDTTSVNNFKGNFSGNFELEKQK